MTTRYGRRFAALLCGLTMWIVASPGFAANNLLANPSFDNDLAGWARLVFSATWSPVDANANVNSGSAIVVNEQNPGSGGVPLVLAQCAAVAPSTPYSFGGRLLVPGGQPAGTRAELFAVTYASVDCSGSPLLYIQQSSDNVVGQWVTRYVDFTTDPTVHSVRIALGALKPVGVTATAAAQFDDVYLQRGAGVTPFAIGPSMSASWFNPAQSGHGITLEILDSAHAWMCWFTFDLAGNRAWICGVGNVGGVTIEFPDAFTVAGGNFPPLFDPARVVQVPWGSIAITFAGCDGGTMTWTTTAAGFQSGSMPLARLTSLWGNACN